VRALLVAVVLGLAGLVQIAPVGDNDVWWLLKAGEHMVTTRTFPTTDPYSWTAQGAPWLNHTWGFELLLYTAFAAGGVSGLIALQAVFAVATFGVMAWTLGRDRVPLPWALGLLGLAALATRGFWAPRPQIVTYLGLAVLWAIVWEYREGRADRLGWIPVLTVVWVNLHGGFLVGLAVLGLATVGQIVDGLFDRGEGVPPLPRAGRMAAVWGLALGAALLNPFHVRALAFPLEVSADRAAKDFIVEWSSPAFQHMELRMFESLLLLLLAGWAVVGRRARLADVALVVASVYLALDATRNIPLFFILLTPLAGRLLTDLGRMARRWARELGGLGQPRVWATAALAALVAAAWVRPLPGQLAPTLIPRAGIASVFPTGAVEFLRKNPLPGPLFNDYGWGGYLIFHLYPQYRVFMDGRIAVFSREVREDFVSINNAQAGWQEALDRRRIGLVLIRNGTALASLLREARDWEVAYQDQQAIVFRRRPGSLA
jgi:hypothetical protein